MFLLEGNMGVGKSTFLKLLEQHSPEVPVIQEPQTSWTGYAHGSSLLGSFYQDPKRWAYTMETYAMVTRVKDHIAIFQKGMSGCLMERSVYSGHYCFAKSGYLNGYFTELEWQIYSQWFDFLVNHHCQPPRGFVYLKASPEVCLERLRKRNRKSEEAVTLEYITQIGDSHDKFLLEKAELAPNLKHVPVLILDASYNLLADKEILFEYINKVKQFMGITRAREVEQVL